MTQREQIDQLREELAEVRKQMSALAVAMVELAAHQPVQYVPYVPYTPSPNWPWPSQPLPWVTYSTATDNSTTSGVQMGGFAINGPAT